MLIIDFISAYCWEKTRKQHGNPEAIVTDGLRSYGADSVFRSTLSLRDLEELLVERGIEVS